MSAEFDPSEFVDSDFQAARQGSSGATAAASTTGAGGGSRAPSRVEVDSKVTEMQQKLVELKHAQQELERERAALEETRRRQSEVATGRQEMEQHLTRGLGLLEEAEFVARRDAEQMAKAIGEFQDALGKVQSIHEAGWSKDNLNVELTRAMTILENARMEWNSARLKFPVLSGALNADPVPSPGGPATLQEALQQKTYSELCKMGLALTWPIALIGLAIVLVLLMRHG